MSTIQGNFTIALDASSADAETFAASADVLDAVTRVIAEKLGVAPSDVYDVHLTTPQRSVAKRLHAARRLTSAVTVGYSVNVPSARLSDSLALLAEPAGLSEGLHAELPDYTLEISEATAADVSGAGEEEAKPEDPGGSGVLGIVLVVVLVGGIAAGCLVLNIGGTTGRASLSDSNLEMAGVQTKSRKTPSKFREQDVGPLDMGSFAGVGSVPLSPRHGE